MTDYASLLSLDGVVFRVDGTQWKTSYIKLPIPANGDMIVYVLGFASQNSDAQERELKLTTSESGLQMDSTGHCKTVIKNLIKQFLGSDKTMDGIQYMCN